MKLAKMVYKRAGIVRAVRNTLENHGYVEVETPMLQLVHGGASARPFKTHLNAFDQEMTLRIATSCTSSVVLLVAWTVYSKSDASSATKAWTQLTRLNSPPYRMLRSLRRSVRDGRSHEGNYP